MSSTNSNLFWLCRTTFALFVILFLFSSSAFAGGKVGIYGIHMVPRGDDAKNYSRPGYGLGIHIVAPLPQLLNTVAGTAGFEYINLMSETMTFRDQFTGLRVEHETDQHYSRLFI